jgi:hypothetical protein
MGSLDFCRARGQGGVAVCVVAVVSLGNERAGVDVRPRGVRVTMLDEDGLRDERLDEQGRERGRRDGAEAGHAGSTVYHGTRAPVTAGLAWGRAAR